MKLIAILGFLLTLASCQTAYKSPLPEGAPDTGILIVEFGASWCPSCVTAKPELAALAKKYDAEFFYVDTDTIKERPLFFAWSFIPAVAVFNHQRIFYFGPYDKARMAETIQDLVWAREENRKTK